jgi:predicted GNAT family acetyltransferase
MDIKHALNMVYMGDEASPIAKLVWKPLEGDVILATETFVDPSLRGQGVAKKLLDETVSYARQNGLKIKPKCSYVVIAFERYKEYQDIIAA